MISTPLGSEDLAALGAAIGRAGADKLLLCEAEDFGAPAWDASRGRALDAAVTRVPPMLILFPTGGSGFALGPPLAARMGCPFFPWCDITVSDSDAPARAGVGRVQLQRLLPDGRTRRRLDPVEIERPIVVTVGAGLGEPPTGSPGDLEIEVVPIPGPPDAPAVLEIDSSPSPHASLALASALVLIDAASPPGSDLPVETLAAGAPPGTIVARLGDVSADVLLGCCPELVITIGPRPAVTARRPRTRVVLVSPPGTADPVPDEVDVLWPLRDSSELTPAVLADLLSRIGGGA